MGRAYTVKCKHCGTQFDHYTGTDWGRLQMCVGCETYVETQMPIRCPNCMKRLNSTQQEFNEQVEITYLWD